jgi:hypothetical protein
MGKVMLYCYTTITTFYLKKIRKNEKNLISGLQFSTTHNGFCAIIEHPLN